MWQTGSLDGLMWSQPLVYGSRVYVATENDTVYALDASTGSVVWQRHLATPVPSGHLPCGDISPVVGITGTPVIDPATNRIFVDADTWDGSTIRHELFGLNLGDGSVAVGPVAADPPGSIPANQLQRASLALDAGRVIIGEGGNDGDCGAYHGWLIAIPEAGGSMQTFEVDGASGENEGAIWGAGNAPPVDSAGNIWTSTGNGSSSSFDYQESVIKLNSKLSVLDHWAPSNWASLDSSDADLGSSMPVLLPGGLVFEIGKAGVGYLLSASSLGGTGAAPVYQASVCGGSWGGGIYVTGVIYVTCSNGIHALSLNTTARTFAALPGWTVNSNAIGPPMYAGGLVWSAGTNTGVLYALDPGSGATRYSDSLGSFEHFTTASAGGGRLFVANGNKVTAIQIATAPAVTATRTALASSANPTLAGSPVTFTATVSPAPDAGTVAFTDRGTAIPGCSAVAVSAGGHANCPATYRVASRHAIAAVYSGDPFYGASSGALTQVVKATAPAISHLRTRVIHRKLWLGLTISLRARLTVTIYRRVPGRIARRHCRAGAKHGRKCGALVRKAKLTLAAKRGKNTFSPRMRSLAPGRYVVAVSAVTLTGGRSKTYRTAFVVRVRTR